ncbi:hypothetical protein GCM10022206_53940 [Streptomyces chiangmaiensis]
MGNGGCSHCARHQFDRVGPALVYAYQHHGFRAVKIGVTSDLSRGRRLSEMRNGGWHQLKTWLCEPGELALTIERAVLVEMRFRCGPQPFLRPEDMPMGGHTETFDALVVEPSDLVGLINEAWLQTAN